MAEETVIVCTRVPVQWAAWLDEIAEKNGFITRSQVVRHAIEQYLMVKKNDLTIKQEATQ